MSVLDDAIILEERAQIQYRDAAARLGDPSAKGILEFLSGEETKHAAALRAMKRGLYEGLAAFSLGEAPRTGRGSPPRWPVDPLGRRVAARRPTTSHGDGTGDGALL